jgi:hypothetical protein
MSGVKRDSAMANLPWPACSARSASRNADTDAPMDPTSGTSPTTSAPSYALHATEMITPPFATADPMTAFNHPGPHQRGEYFTEQTVHTVTFKTYTYNGERRELWVNEVNNNGFTRLRRPEQFDHALFLRTSDYWRAYFHMPLQNEGSPCYDFSDNQLPLTTGSQTSTAPALASQLLQLLFGQPTSGSTPAAPASAITRGIPKDQLQALAHGLRALASSSLLTACD